MQQYLGEISDGFGSNQFRNLKDEYWNWIIAVSLVLFFISPLCLLLYYTYFVFESGNSTNASLDALFASGIISSVGMFLYFQIIAKIYFAKEGYNSSNNKIGSFVLMISETIFSQIFGIIFMLGFTFTVGLVIIGVILVIGGESTLSYLFGFIIYPGYLSGVYFTTLHSFTDVGAFSYELDKSIQQRKVAHQHIEKGSEMIESGDHESAQHEFRQAKELLESARYESKKIDTGLNEDIQEAYDEVMTHLSTVEKNLVTEELTSIPSDLTRIEALVSTGEYNNTDEALSHFESKIASINERISENEISELEPEIEDIEEKFNSLVEEKERRDARVRLSDEIESVRSNIEHVQTLMKNGENLNARTKLEKIESDIESAKETSQQYGLEDCNKEFMALEQRCTALIDEINEQREDKRRGLQEEIETHTSVFEEANALTKGGQFEQAQAKLQELESDIKSAKETAVQQGFDDLQEELTTLEQRHQDHLEEVTEQIESYTIPEDIPRAPSLSVDYGALTDKKPIGGGGNADVTKATLATSDGGVALAIKEPRMSGTLHTAAVSRMLEEAETWDKLDDHDHIVGVVDYGSTPVPWIAMEYMNGDHLGAQSGQMDIQQALWTAIAVTKGVRHAHRRGVAHLDLKPENILFRTVGDAWDVPKVADWGLSKHLLDHSKSVEGLSPQYAAPEQFDEDFGSADDITDIYQLGAVFYELFTGRPPFEGKPAKAMHKVLHEQPTPPSEIADVPDGLDEILLTALAKEKAERYDGILYLRDEFQHVLDEYSTTREQIEVTDQLSQIRD